LSVQSPEPIEDRIERVAAKVRARNLGMGKCVSESDLVAFERHYGITLPNEYREFVLRVGNGAPGPPDYGLIKLAEPPNGKGDYTSHTTEELANMKTTFPFTKPWVWEDGVASDEGIDDQVRDGQLYLGSDGCGMDWALIITGPDRGIVWWFSGEGIQPTSPKRDFLRWFEDWLDGVRDWWT
jgi:SMI1 / KNR4 family (SUKH-1)